MKLFFWILSFTILAEIVGLYFSNFSQAWWSKSPEKDMFLKQSIVRKNLTPECWTLIWDVNSDNSITRYLSKNSLASKNYVPWDLIKIESENIKQYETNFWRKEAVESLYQLAWEYKKFFWHTITLTSAYRSYDEQLKLYNLPNANKNIVALPWTSEHQLGLAFDIIDETNQKLFKTYPQSSIYYQWLNRNAYRFWFVQTYQFWVDDGFNEESWHRRYIWKPSALKLRFENISYFEYVKACKKF